jgi:hypothetical protein
LASSPAGRHGKVTTVILADPLPLALKCGIASALAIVAARMVGVHDALSAAFVATACISPSAYAGLRGGIAQLAGSLLGVACAAAPLLFRPELDASPFVAGVGVSVAVLGCLAFRSPRAIPVAAFSVLYIHLVPGQSALHGVVERIGAVLLGVLVATLANTLVSALDGERIAARRTARVRSAVAEAMAASAARIARRGEVPDSTLAQAFEAVAALRVDLGHAAREHGFPGAKRARSSAATGLVRAAGLEEATHLAKECVLASEGLDEADRSRFAAHVESLASRLRGASIDASVRHALRDWPPDEATRFGWLMNRLERAVDVAIEG